MAWATWELILASVSALAVATALGAWAIRRWRSSRRASSAQHALIVSRVQLDSGIVSRSPGTIGSQRPATPIRKLSPSVGEISSATTRETGEGLAFLYTCDGPQTGEPIPLNSRVTRIGRDRRWADYVVDDNTVSAIHLSIRHKNGAFVLTDLDSENGTMVNGMRVLQHELARRDVIVIGRTTLMFMQLPAPAPGSDQPIP
jgi:pSer/pThr/pTyr-binding forkhead associated (FHA) protein